MALLICENITLGYGSRVLAEHLSFSVEPGEYLCILGENGSGKTTLLKVLLGLRPPLSGSVRWQEGGPLGYLPQQVGLRQDFPASVEEIVLSGCLAERGLRPFYSRAQKRLAADWLERLGVAELAGRCYRELSGGQQRRVLLARALCAGKKALLLDEPAAGLDREAADEMYRLLAELNGTGRTILMITHDPDPVLSNAHKVLRLGRKPFFGSREAYLRECAEGGIGQ